MDCRETLLDSMYTLTRQQNVNLLALIQHVKAHPRDTGAAETLLLQKGTPMQCVWFTVYVRQSNAERLTRHIQASGSHFAQEQLSRLMAA